MQLQMTTEYAIRILGFLFVHKRIVQVTEISNALNISPTYMQKVLGKLVRSGVIASAQGRYGGYYFLKSAEEISLYDVIELMENEIALLACLSHEASCSQEITDCPLQDVFRKAQEELIRQFQNVKISKMWTKSDFSDP